MMLLNVKVSTATVPRERQGTIGYREPSTMAKVEALLHKVPY